jgi:phosphoglycolate phosphatase-like HAD superfamily hydrolase
MYEMSRARQAMVTIVVDPDGTLVNTASDLIDTLNLTLSEQGLAVCAARRCPTADRKWGKQHDRADTSAQRSGRADHIADHSRPFPGLEDVLNRLVKVRGLGAAAVCKKVFRD